ncbi:hypothetical protein CVT25_004710 [Psilocybe cyanescens]|uniref:Uncharacterized protein n=1 Tax=Psilocybe cyanescens TaxID=93625 RepID=A0A409XIS8_PSICY|nr:hypothetical protein CVT25_004710 [Psilocybe cyanescens]
MTTTKKVDKFLSEIYRQPKRILSDIDNCGGGGDGDRRVGDDGDHDFGLVVATEVEVPATEGVERRVVDLARAEAEWRLLDLEMGEVGRRAVDLAKAEEEWVREVDLEVEATPIFLLPPA